MPKELTGKILCSPRDLRRLDFILLFLCFLLLFAGGLFIYGAGQKIGGDFESYWIKQAGWTALGGVFCFLVAAIDYRTLGRWSWLLYIFGVSLLVLVLFVGIEINAARSWLPIPYVGTLQPGELTKPATLLFVAWLLSYLKENLRIDTSWIFALVAGAIPAGLIALQPDWGTALVYIPAVLAMVFVSGIRWRWIGVGVGGLLVTAPIIYNFILETRQKERLTTFLRPDSDISGAGWTAHQSLLAVGSGGVSGKGFMQGTQHVLGYLPQNVASTDFIFSVIAEETGFIGSIALLCAFAGILVCALRTALVANDRLGMILATGIATLFFVHIYINIGMTVLMSPVIGIPLPFISYGGSFMLSMLIFVGLLQSIYIRR